ncbi:MAG: dihydrodipicolinate synthase family protein [Alphaproteobacteria bacterium]|jgi:4-hydroxy-tetrahydrodipicolinate synthase|nr:dihydrodipicolinate synthase family protein [Alphaproteobacteria bacterium]
MTIDDLNGIIAYPVTPFRGEQPGIDEDAFRQVTENLLRSKPAAIAYLGSTGESAYLTDEEWRQAAKLGVDTVRGRVPVIVGISELTTAAATQKARYAEEVGADMLMVIPVSYWKLAEDEIYDHFAAIAQASDLPIMAYNNPATSGVDMPPALLVELVHELKTVVSIKESSGDLNRMHAIQTLSQGQIPFYSGSNHLTLEALAAGASGWCTAAPNLLDHRPAELFERMSRSEIGTARELFYDLFPLLEFIVRGGLPTTVKAGLRLRGIEAGDPRLPLKPLPGAERGKLAGYLETIGVTPVPQEVTA